MGGARITPSSATRCARPVPTATSLVCHTCRALRFASPCRLGKGRHGENGLRQIASTHGRTDRSRIGNPGGSSPGSPTGDQPWRRAVARPTRHGRARRRVCDALRRLAHDAGPARSDLHRHDQCVASEPGVSQFLAQPTQTFDATDLGILPRRSLRTRTSDPFHHRNRQGVRAPGFDVTRPVPRPSLSRRHQSHKGGINP